MSVALPMVKAQVGQIGPPVSSWPGLSRGPSAHGLGPWASTPSSARNEGVDTRIKMVWGGRRGNGTIAAGNPRWSTPMPQPNDLSRSLTALDQDSTLIVIIEMSQASWLVGASVPGIERHPLKKLAPDAEELLQVLQLWGGH